MDQGVYRLQGETEVVTTHRDVVIALGSNVGDRERHLLAAVSGLGSLLADLRVSSFVETEPEGVVSQRSFLNGVVVGKCDLSAIDLMGELLAIEGTRGRRRPYPGAPRTLDLDLILLGSLVMTSDDVQVPHPRFRERRFVLEPLVELAPEWIDPVSGHTVRELFTILSKRDRLPPEDISDHSKRNDSIGSN